MGSVPSKIRLLYCCRDNKIYAVMLNGHQKMFVKFLKLGPKLNFLQRDKALKVRWTVVIKTKCLKWMFLKIIKKQIYKMKESTVLLNTIIFQENSIVNEIVRMSNQFIWTAPLLKPFAAYKFISFWSKSLHIIDILITDLC